MSERYSRLFLLQENLYAQGAPVVIAAGALLKDNMTAKVVAQLKFRSITEKPIQALKVSLTSFDPAGRVLGDAVEHQYLDLNAERDEEFGQKVPVPLPDDATRAFSVRVTEVIFADQTVWTAGDAPWESLSDQTPLELALEDKELLKQYKIKYGDFCRYVLLREKDLWHCTCGALNRQEESCCHRCQKEADLLEHADLDALKQERDDRLEAEAKAAEEARLAAEAKAQQEREEAEAREKAAREKAEAIAKAARERAESREKAIKKWAKIIVAAAAAAAVIAVLVVQVIIPYTQYSNAVSLMESGKYKTALRAFQDLGDYKDCQEKIEACRTGIKDDNYSNAVSLMEAGEYREAINKFSEEDGYKDSSQRIYECKYEYAKELLANESYSGAYWLLSDIPSEYDVADLKEKAWNGAVYQKLKQYLSDGNLYSALVCGSMLPSGYEDVDAFMTRYKKYGGLQGYFNCINNEYVSNTPTVSVKIEGDDVYVSVQYYNKEFYGKLEASDKSGYTYKMSDSWQTFYLSSTRLTDKDGTMIYAKEENAMSAWNENTIVGNKSSVLASIL